MPPRSEARCRRGTAGSLRVPPAPPPTEDAPPPKRSRRESSFEDRERPRQARQPFRRLFADMEDVGHSAGDDLAEPKVWVHAEDVAELERGSIGCVERRRVLVDAHAVAEHDSRLQRCVPANLVEHRHHGSAGSPAVQPPSTGRTTPVTALAAGLARKTAVYAISAGSSTRPIGIRRSRAAVSRGLASSPSIIGVAVKPGATAWTRTPAAAQSIASERVNAATAPLLGL